MPDTGKLLYARDRILQFAFALFMVAIATYIRVLLTPTIHDGLPFGTFTLAVIMVAWITGVWPAVLALIASTLSAAHFIVPPEHSLAITAPAHQIGVIIFFTVGTISIVLFSRIESQHRMALAQVVENRELNAALVQRDKQKDEFLALLAHELRNPLAPIGNAIVLLERERDMSPPARRILGSLAKNFTHLVRLTNDLLDVSRYMRDAIELQLETTNLVTCIETAVEMTRQELQDKNHELITDFPETPINANVDQVRMSQVLCNLLSNAIKYTPERGRIVIRLKQNDTDIRIEVQDNGLGIPSAIREQVFTAFFQANPKQSRFAPGLGLGLSIVKKLVELHGGRVEVVSQGANNGSRFIVSLPTTLSVDNAGFQESSSMPRAHEALPTSDASGRKVQGQIAAQAPELDPRAESKRILIVDDDHDTADSLSTLLRMDGFDTRIAHSGLDAIAAYHAYCPSVILMDIGLPEMSGYEVAIQLRQEASSHALKIIALSGWGAEADIKKGEAAGFDVHLVKPVRYGQLLSHIQLHDTNQAFPRTSC